MIGVLIEGPRCASTVVRTTAGATATSVLLLLDVLPAVAVLLLRTVSPRGLSGSTRAAVCKIALRATRESEGVASVRLCIRSLSECEREENG